MLRKRLLCCWLVLCLMAGLCATALAASSVGSSASALTPSTAKSYICLSKNVVFFTGETYGQGTKKIGYSGEVYQLVCTDFYSPSDGNYYYGIYADSKRYNVLRSDVYDDIMTESELNTYIKDEVWGASSFTSMKESMKLVGDIRVHGLQLALKQLGYYTGTPDGNYGSGTASAVKSFQKANSLTADGVAGVITQPLIYAMAGGTPSASVVPTEDDTADGTVSADSTGTIVTTVSVNLRKAASKKSALLAVVPAKVSLTFSTTVVSGGVTWYKVTYSGLTGYLMGTYVSVKGSGGGSGSSAGTLVTIASVNLRKAATTSSARLAIVPKKVSLKFTNTTTVKNVRWYYVSYAGQNGWVMGTYVSVTGEDTDDEVLGTVKIIKSSTRMRQTPNGTKTGYVLALNSTASYLAITNKVGGYVWYLVRTSSGVEGYVRGDCVEIVEDPETPTTESHGFVKLTAKTALFTTQTKPSSGYITLPKGTVLLHSINDNYTVSGVSYVKLYYNNKLYNCAYSDIASAFMSESEITTYLNNLYSQSLGTTLKASMGLKGNVKVYALQAALQKLGYYTDTVDGIFGSTTTNAVKNFQRGYKLTVDGSCGTKTWTALCKAINGTADDDDDDDDTEFGTINKIVKATWTTSDNGASIFAKGTYATVMDVQTGKVFKVYRWSGGSHADCVPATEADTKTMCEIVGFTYNSNHPTAAQLAKIKADGDSSTVKYTWPDFKASFGGTATNIGSAWDRRPALLNVNGTVYCVSIYGFPHGFTGTSSFSKSKFPNGQYFYEANNYYGMMCIHFVGSCTHSSTTPDANHQKNIQIAYNYAKTKWPSLCK